MIVLSYVCIISCKKYTTDGSLLSSTFLMIVFQCSLKDCGWRTEDSSVEEFKHKYLAIHNTSQTFQCYCDQLENGKCVDHKKYSKAGAIHSLVWPFIFLVLGIVILIITRCGCPDKYFRRNQYYEVQ